MDKLLYQEWRDLLFLHWVQDPKLIEKTLPQGLNVDTFAGDAYITLIPFFMPKVSISKTLTIPGMNNFLEVNVRTYVRDQQGNPGIWFYSLDINSFFTSMMAPWLFHLPYRYANIEAKRSSPITYQMSNRKSHESFKAHYHLASDQITHAAPASLTHFLVERYCLFNNKLFMQKVRHASYPLCEVKLLSFDHTMTRLPTGLPHHIHFSPGVDVDVLPMQKHS